MSALKVYSETPINASDERAWSVLTSFEKYNQWNDVFIDFEGYAQKGKTLHFKISALPGIALPIRECEILVADQMAKELRWQGPAVPVVRDIVNGNHYFKIVPMGEGKCKLIHGEDFDGWITPLLAPVLQGLIEQMYEKFNAAFKAECEK